VFVPCHFRPSNPDAAWKVIAANGFGTLVTGQTGGAPVASPLPFVGHPNEGMLVGHMARANPQLQLLKRSKPASVLVIFQGASGFVSGSYYDEPFAVPTWDHVSVHVAGTLRLVHGNAATLGVLEQTVAHFEAQADSDWRLDVTRPDLPDMVELIAAFEVAVERIDASFKLSQNVAVEQRRPVVAGVLSAGNHRLARAIEAENATTSGSETVSDQGLLAGAATELQEAARRHLWLHFAPLGRDEELTVFVRGEGCYVYDQQGRRYLDALSSLFCVNVGHGRGELADAAGAQARELAYATTWGTAHPRAVELATRVAQLAPGDLNRVFFTSGGSEAVESALKLAHGYHRACGEPTRVKVIARELAYHGTTLGALSATGLPSVRDPFEPLIARGCHVPHTDSYRNEGADPSLAADAIEERILLEGPDTVSAVILEPVQNSGGCIPPPPDYFQAVRRICDRYGVLLISDDTICSWGRLGTWFGAQRFDYLPDIITTAKGMTSAYVPMGAMIASDRVAEPFLEAGALFAHGLTFGGHPVAAAVALANIDLLEQDALLDHVRANEPLLRSTLEALYDLPIVGDVRGAGYFWGIELVRDQASKQRFDADTAQELTESVLAPALHQRGLICRASDRGYPVIQLAPPLTAGIEQFEEIGEILRSVLSEACTRTHTW